MQAENMLTISKSKANISTGLRSSSESFDDGDNIEEIKPGDKVDLLFEIESEFDDDRDENNPEIEDITLTVENDDLDVDEEETASDLDPKETDDLDVSFDVPVDASRSDEDLEIKLIGRDEFGAEHGALWELTLEVEREKHEIDISNLVLTPGTVSCQHQTELEVEIRNIGRSDEDQVYIQVVTPGLLFEERSEEIELDEGDEKTRSFTIPVPENTPAGPHKITVEVFYEGSKRIDSNNVALTKINCASLMEPVTPPKTVTPVKQVEEIIVQEVTPLYSPEPEVTEPAKKKQNFFDSPTFLVLLAAGYIVVIGFGVAIIMALAKK